MKNLLIVLSLMALSIPVFAQDDENFSIASQTSDSRDRFVMEAYWATLLDAPESFNIQSKSRGFNFYFFFDVPIGGDNVSIAPGIGMDMPNIFHSSLLTVDTDTSSQTLGNTMITSFDTAGIGAFKKNKLAMTYLDIPVELRFRTNRNTKGNRFKFAVGFKAGLLLTSHTKYIGEEYRAGRVIPGDTDFTKIKEFRVRNLNGYRYGVTGRVGYGNVNLQTFYGLSGLFEDGLGPGGNIFTIGISFNSF